MKNHMPVLLLLGLLCTPAQGADLLDLSQVGISTRTPATVHFENARSAFKSNDYVNAANELREGAKIMEVDHKGLPASESNALKAAAKNVYQLAEKVAKKKVKDLGEFDEELKSGIEVAQGDMLSKLKGFSTSKPKSASESQPTSDGSGSVNPKNPRGAGTAQ